MSIIKNSLEQSHEVISKAINPGDTVIDATAGKGNDTVFLAKLVGPSGKVYSFDIQQEALQSTEKKLSDSGFLDRVQLINDGHENLDLYINENVNAVMFNLGYLPGGNHSIRTKAATTIMALNKAMNLLKPNGIISIVVYYGGDSGFDEKEGILDYIETIDCSNFTVMRTEFVNQINCPPILICIEKIKGV